VVLVLVVEDEESFSDALSYMLRKEGFEVTVCPTGPDALAAFDRNGADLVLLDLMLPGPPGTEVFRSLRERSDVPVIMLTARDTEVDMAVGLELGADDYVTKPFTWHELATRIQAVLRRRGQVRPRAGAISLARGAKRASTRGWCHATAHEMQGWRPVARSGHDNRAAEIAEMTAVVAHARSTAGHHRRPWCYPAASAAFLRWFSQETSDPSSTFCMPATSASTGAPAKDSVVST
jgi:CheY-like chemotaxis protein